MTPALTPARGGHRRALLTRPAALVILLAGGLAAACGSSSVTNVTAPDGSRCAASVTADPVTVVPDGATVSVTISAERECTWSARSDAAWLLLRQTSGQGEASISATVARNDQPVSRSAALTVNDQRLTITQQPRPCDLSLQGFAGTIPFTGGTGTVRVNTIAGCTWTATSSAPWLLVRTPSGSGASDVTFDVLANGGPAREATITVAGQTTVIGQAAVITAPVCTYAIDSQSQAFPVAGGSGAVTVSTPGECEWTATGGTSWVTLLTTSGTGPGQAGYQVSANTTTQARQTTLTIAGRVHTVTQPGLSCTYSISAAGAAFPASGGTGSLQVNTLGGCSWTASSNAGWIVVGTSSGSGPGQIPYQVLANVLPSQRTGTITVGGQTHTVTQAGVPPPCTYSLDPTSGTYPAAGGLGTVTVNTPGDHCSWTAASSATWITIASGSASGSGTAQVSYSVAENTATTQRTGTVTIGGQTHTVTQSGATVCTYAIDLASGTYSADGGQGTVTVTTGPTCAWTATSSAPWITVGTPSSGTGTAAVSYAVAANTTTSPRSGTLTIGGQTHTITQAGATVCTYAIDPASGAYSADGGQGTVTLKTGATCAWTATSSAPWITVGNPSGTGTAAVSYAVAANTTTTPRSGTVTIGGQTHSVTQAGVCTYALSPGSIDVPASASQNSVTVTTQAGCAWTATSSAPWITLTPGPTSGSGTATVTYSVAANTTPTPRTGSIQIAGQTHVITQAGAAVAIVCAYALTPEERSFGSEGGPGTIALTTEPTCTWTAVSSSGWVQVIDGSGTGSAVIRYTVNASGGTRTATISVGGQTHRITQTSMAL